MTRREQSAGAGESITSGFTQIGAQYRVEGIFVPLVREKELASYLDSLRQAAKAEAEAQQEVLDFEAQNRAEGSKISLDAKLEQEEAAAAEFAAGVAPAEIASDEEAFVRVACVNHEDLLAQKKAAESNMKFSDRDRTSAVKAITKALLARPLTRRIGQPIDVEAAMQRLTQVAPHVGELVEALRIPLLVSSATAQPPMFAPLLLVGPAGVGKSHIALQIAQILGVPAHSVSYAASGAAGNVLSGADKSWGNSSTGIVFNALTEGEFANPVILLDEIDKASVSGSMSGPDRHPLNELLPLLEPVTAREHRDRCAEIRVDARHIVWVATANSLQGLSAPLLSRFRIVMVRKPDARAAVTIALSVAAAVVDQMGVAMKAPSGEVLQMLATLTPRTVRRVWTGAAGWAAAAGRDRVTMIDIEQSLGLGVVPEARLH